MNEKTAQRQGGEQQRQGGGQPGEWRPFSWKRMQPWQIWTLAAVAAIFIIWAVWSVA